jgi:hypothetical protein
MRTNEGGACRMGLDGLLDEGGDCLGVAAEGRVKMRGGFQVEKGKEKVSERDPGRGEKRTRTVEVDVRSLFKTRSSADCKLIARATSFVVNPQHSEEGLDWASSVATDDEDGVGSMVWWVMRLSVVLAL